MTTWRLVEDGTKSEMFGVNLEIDEKALIAAIAAYVIALQSKYRPKEHIINCRLIPDPDSFTVTTR